MDEIGVYLIDSQNKDIEQNKEDFKIDVDDSQNKNIEPDKEVSEYTYKKYIKTNKTTFILNNKVNVLLLDCSSRNLLLTLFKLLDILIIQKILNIGLKLLEYFNFGNVF